MKVDIKCKCGAAIRVDHADGKAGLGDVVGMVYDFQTLHATCINAGNALGWRDAMDKLKDKQ